MQTIKLHEATKQFGISNKLAMFFLEKKHLPVKSHSSVISMEQLVMLREFSENKEKFPDVVGEFNRIKKEKERRKKAQKAKGEEIPVEIKEKEEIKKEPEIEVKKPEIKEKKPEFREIKPEFKKEPERRPRFEPPKVKREEKRTGEAKIEVRPGAEAKQIPKNKVRPEERRVKVEHPRPPKERTGEIEKKVKAKVVEDDKERQRKPAARVPAAPAPPPRPPKQKFEKPRPRYQNRGRKPKRFVPKRTKQGPPPPRPPKPEPPKPKVRVYNLPEMIQISDKINIKELAEKLNLKLRDIEERMWEAMKKEYVSNQILDVAEVQEICKEFKVEVDIVSFEDAIFYSDIEKLKAELSDRAPVVTVMGHVDHGKTTLLDTLRDTHTAEKEAGGITQKIGAYKLNTNGADIVFLDTPGHEAFTNIRARGAKVTDIVILVVAANDGVKPQTIEAINHAKAAEVPIVVAINKIDLSGADTNKVKQELAQRDVVVEDWGGQVVSVEISAKHNQNLDSLLEMIALQAEMLELKAYKDIPARGTIIESRLDPQLGPMGTVLIQHGQVKIGDFFICGEAVGRVKSIFDDQGNVQDNAEVPLPVEIMGFENVPEAGERFQVAADVEKARKVIDMRKLKEKTAKNEEVQADKKLSLQNLFERLEENKIKVFPIIIKSDNFSSSEVLENILLKQNQEKIKINIIHKGIGNMTESDILLASTSDSIIVGFNVKAPQKILNLAKQEHIQIRLYNVIYHLIEDIEKAIKGEIEPEYVETHIGTVEVLQIFKISKIGTIAGCLVKEGKVTNKSSVKVFRKDDLVFEGAIENLKRVKNDVVEVNAGTECGIRVKNFNAIEIGDILQVYETTVKE